VTKQIDPYLKNAKMFLFVMAGSERYREKVINEFTRQTGSTEVENERGLSQLKVKEVLAWPWQRFEWLPVYQIRRDEQIKENMFSRINSVELIVRNMEVNVVRLEGVGDMRTFELLTIDDDMLEVVKYCSQLLTLIHHQHGSLLKTEDQDEDLLAEAVKKLSIFNRSITKMKNCSEHILRYYSLFELIVPSLTPHF
jgi:hypothetical protein